VDPLVAHARTTIEQGSRSFAAAARLFDAPTRARAFMLYAWCRHCDDRIDGQALGFGQYAPEPEAQRAALAELTRQTGAAMAGEPVEEPAFAAFQRVYRECGIGRRYPLELLQGFRMDVEGYPYDRLDDTLLYSYHVAGVVGAMMATVMGVKDAATLERAVDLGIAFQLTNICRDVMEDAANGRVYLPSAWLREAGAPTDPREFPGNEDKLVLVVRRLLDEADRYYDSSRHGIARLPARSAWAVAAARAVYRDIGRRIRARGAHAWDGRASVGRARKLALLLGSGATALALVLSQRSEAPPRRGLWTAP
jgi:15-cis-phytoene synthase